MEEINTFFDVLNDEVLTGFTGRSRSKREIQKDVDMMCIDACNDCITIREKFTPISIKRLRSCNAQVYEYPGLQPFSGVCYMLKSYNTFVAAIVDGAFYDFLRYSYGYTATSAQHISKFKHDYKYALVSPDEIYTYRPV